MSALINLHLRIASDPTWKREFDNSSKEAERWAERMPLVHVFSPKNSVAQMVVLDELLQPSSNARSKTTTLRTEQEFALGRHLYFYAGRAYPLHGGIGLIFSAATEAGKRGNATPFDTGGLLNLNPRTGQPYIRTNLGPDRTALYQFLFDSIVSLAQWRTDFAQFLAAYFGPLRGYVFGRPAKVDPEEIYAAASGNTWRSWTYEIRFRDPQAIAEAVYWSASKQQMDLFHQYFTTCSPSEQNVLRSFLDRASDKSGSLHYTDEIEQKVYEVVNSTAVV
jgi:hypothetical protein